MFFFNIGAGFFGCFCCDEESCRWEVSSGMSRLGNGMFEVPKGSA